MASRHFVKSLASIEHCGAWAAALDAHCCCWLTGASAGGAASAGREEPKSLRAEEKFSMRQRLKWGWKKDAHVGDTVTDNATTSDTSSGTSDARHHTGLTGLRTGRSVCDGRCSMRRVRRGRGRSGLLVRRTGRGGRSRGRSR